MKGYDYKVNFNRSKDYWVEWGELFVKKKLPYKEAKKI